MALSDPGGGSAVSWDEVYAGRDSAELSWYQRDPAVSLRLLADHPGSVVDVGAGTSFLVDRLVDAGRDDLTLVDLSRGALERSLARLGARRAVVKIHVGDVLDWTPGRTFDVWHDRAAFHFLTDPADQERYASTAARLVRARGAVIVATFSPDGPTRCSGRPTAQWSAGELEDLFAESFVLEHSEQEIHLTPWGAAQSFTWVVLRRLPERP